LDADDQRRNNLDDLMATVRICASYLLDNTLFLVNRDNGVSTLFTHRGTQYRVNVYITEELI
jgi:hypothetical protein